MACRRWLTLAALLCVAMVVLAASFTEGDEEVGRASNARPGASSPRLKNTGGSSTKGKAAGKGSSTKRASASAASTQGTTRAPVTTARATTAKLKTNSPTRAPKATTTAAPTATTTARLKSPISFPASHGGEAAEHVKASDGGKASDAGKASEAGKASDAKEQPAALKREPQVREMEDQSPTRPEAATQSRNQDQQGGAPVAGATQEPPKEQEAKDVPLKQVEQDLGGRLTEKEKQDGVARHNWYRCKVKPWAQQMAALVWDEALAQVAQRYADSCPTSHNANRSLWYKQLLGSDKNIYVGESIGYGFPTLAHATDDFASKAQHFMYEENGCQPGHSCGPFTQVVWAGSTRLGCARPTGPCPGRHGNSIYVCNYAQGGNVRGKRPYESTRNCVQTDACAAINITNGCDPSCAGLAAGTVCRAADPSNSCAAPSVCDGVHNACPALTPKADGTPCTPSGEQEGRTGVGVCFEGKCDPVHENVYKADFAASPVAPAADCANGDCDNVAGCVPGQSSPAPSEPGAVEARP